MDETSILAPTPYAFWSHTGQQMVLCDLSAGEFLTFNKTATLFWMHLVEGMAPAMIVPPLAARFAVSPEQISADLQAFVHTMQSRNLLSSPGSSLPQKASKRRYVSWPMRVASLPGGEWMETWASLRAVSRHLRQGRDSFLELTRHINQMDAWERIDATDPQLAHLSVHLSQVALWQPYRTACLHHYLTLWWMLRRRGKAVDLVLGCYTHPFTAHVWLECQQEVIHWEVGMSQYADLNNLEALSVIFRSCSTREKRS